MRLKFSKSFSSRLFAQVKYIAKDKPGAARKFETDLVHELQAISKQPFKHRHSIFANNQNVRDLVFKGYTITYRINDHMNVIEVFGLIKNQKK
jgi:plasmid stabilization system protein ParE